MIDAVGKVRTLKLGTLPQRMAPQLRNAVPIDSYDYGRDHLAPLLRKLLKSQGITPQRIMVDMAAKLRLLVMNPSFEQQIEAGKSLGDVLKALELSAFSAGEDVLIAFGSGKKIDKLSAINPDASGTTPAVIGSICIIERSQGSLRVAITNEDRERLQQSGIKDFRPVELEGVNLKMKVDASRIKTIKRGGKYTGGVETFRPGRALWLDFSAPSYRPKMGDVPIDATARTVTYKLMFLDIEYRDSSKARVDILYRCPRN